MQALVDPPLHGQNARCWAVSARVHHLAATTLAKIGEVDLAWIAAERAMTAGDRSGDPVVLASAARAGTHALLAVGRFDEAVDLGETAADWLKDHVSEEDPVAFSVLGMLYLRARYPFRCAVRLSVRSCGAAPITAVNSASIDA